MSSFESCRNDASGVASAGVGTSVATRPPPCRALTLGNGYIFGGAGLATMQAKTPEIRHANREAGPSGPPIGGMADIAVTKDPDRLRRGEQKLTYHYGRLYDPFEQMALASDGEALL
jgi:hypothetical protein